MDRIGKLRPKKDGLVLFSCVVGETVARCRRSDKPPPFCRPYDLCRRSYQAFYRPYEPWNESYRLVRDSYRLVRRSYQSWRSAYQLV